MSCLYKVCAIILLLIVGSHRISGSEDADRNEDIAERNQFSRDKAQSVLRVLIKLPNYYGQAFKLSKVFELVEDIFEEYKKFYEIDDETRLDALNSKIDKYNADVQTLKIHLSETLKDEFNKKSVEDKLTLITLKMEIINKNFYARFLEYTDPKKTGQEWYILKWVNEVLDTRSGLAEPLLTIKTSLLTNLVEFGSSYNNILDLLASPKLVNDLMCVREKSAQQSIYNFYENIILTEVRSYLMTIFSIEVVNQVYDQTRKTETIQKEFETRMSEIYGHVKIALTEASREIWRCDERFILGQTYSSLKPIFQKYILHEADAHEELVGSWLGNLSPILSIGCEKSCPDLSGSRLTKCSDDVCSHDESKVCTGTLRDCELKHSDMTVCISKTSSSRRYEYIRTNDDQFYGLKNNCSTSEITASSQWLGFGDQSCDYCMCTCDSSQNEKNGLFIDTRPVETDVSHNRVVTGIRIVSGDIIHFEITEGELLPNGLINASTLNTIQSPRRDRSSIESKDNADDFFRISWDSRTICLDDLEAPKKDEVLTGVKFQVTEDNIIELAIQLTPFHFYTGKLMKKSSYWRSHNDFLNSPERSELFIRNLDMPRGKDANKPRSRPNQCFEFQTTGMEQDVGQTIVPFIDIQSVTNNPPTAMSGAGIFLRGSDTTGGFLTPKLFTLDVSHYMPAPKINS